MSQFSTTREQRRQLARDNAKLPATLTPVPADRDVINVANMRHLWVMRDPLPFAWKKGSSA